MPGSEITILDFRFPIWKSLGMSTPIKAWRQRVNRPAEDVATEAGVTLAMWSRWETGARQLPASRVLDVERITGISRHDLRPDVFGPAKQGEVAA